MNFEFDLDKNFLTSPKFERPPSQARVQWHHPGRRSKWSSWRADIETYSIESNTCKHTTFEIIKLLIGVGIGLGIGIGFWRYIVAIRIPVKYDCLIKCDPESADIVAGHLLKYFITSNFSRETYHK